jgi:alpha-tubulin suppressor-like RCC1 family protein
LSVVSAARGELWTWGSGIHYNLGNGPRIYAEFPCKVELAGNVRQVACGFRYALALLGALFISSFAAFGLRRTR